MDEISQFYKEIVDFHKSTFDPNNIRDVIDSYILEIQTAKEEGRSERLFDGKDADRQMQQIIGDMFSAGTESVKTTLQWATVFALREPLLQSRVQEELDQVVGRRYVELHPLHLSKLKTYCFKSIGDYLPWMICPTCHTPKLSSWK